MSRYYYKKSLDAVYEAGIIVHTVKDPDVCMIKILGLLKDYLGMDRGIILLYDSSTGALRAKRAVGIAEEVYRDLSYMPGEGLIGKAFKFDMPIIVPAMEGNEVHLDNLTSQEIEGSLSFLAVPIKYSGKVFGVLAVDRKAAEFQSYDTDTNVLKMISNYLAIFLNDHSKHDSGIGLPVFENSASELKYEYTLEEIAGKTGVFNEVMEKAELYSKSTNPVLIRGERGSGIETVSRTLHERNAELTGDYVILSCRNYSVEGGVQALFGATQSGGKMISGAVEQARFGTLFLDEVSELDIESQKGLLSYIETGEFSLGSAIFTPDARIICGSAKDLEALVRTGKFLPELYYRVSVMTIDVPPLKARIDDLPAIGGIVLDKINEKTGKDYYLSPDAAALVIRCGMPGNIRALEACLDKAVLECRGKAVKAKHFECKGGDMCRLSLVVSDTSQDKVKEIFTKDEESEELIRFLKDDDAEEKVIIQALEKTGWVQAKAARLLGMTTRQINYRIKKYDIRLNKI